MKNNTRLGLAVMALGIACMVISACKKDLKTSSGQTSPNATTDGDMVVTPYGNVPASHVFAVDNKTTVKISKGRLQKVDIATGNLVQDLGALTADELMAVDPYAYATKFTSNANARNSSSAAIEKTTSTNYPGYTAQASATNVQSFTTKWVVPPVPQESASTTTTFLWNGLSGGALQPVLMWGGTAGGAFYAIANWYFVAGNYFHGTYVNVSPGTQLEGVITYLSHTDTSWIYKESFTGYTAADVTVTRTTEATDVIECWEAYTNIVTQWPHTLYSAMTNIKLTTRTGTPPATFSWSVSGGAVTTPSGNNTVVVSNSTSNGEIDFYFDSNFDSSIVSGSNYKIISAVNNTSLLDVTGSGTTDGTKVELYSANTPTSNNQVWKVTSVGSGYYKLQPLNATTKALDVTGGVSTDSTQIEIYADNGGNGQKWRIVSIGGGYFRLTPACATSSALDVKGSSTANGTKIQILGTNNGLEQKFKFVKQ